MLAAEKDGFDIPRPKISYTVDDYVFNGMAYAQKIIKKLFAELGAKEHEWEFSDVIVDKFFSGSAHIMGTTIMGNDPRTSVVDAECRSHDHPNLFIAGGSVFPTGSCTNPTITLAALALRIAARIKKQLQP